MNPLDTLILRPGERDDWNRVRTDWKLSFATSPLAHELTDADTWRGGKAGPVYWAWQEAVVERLLRRATLTIATWAEDIRSIVGWCVTEAPDVVHYVFVVRGPRVDDSHSSPYRKLGIAKRLLGDRIERPQRYTHRSAACAWLPIPSHWTYDPRPALDGSYKETHASTPHSPA